MEKSTKLVMGVLALAAIGGVWYYMKCKKDAVASKDNKEKEVSKDPQIFIKPPVASENKSNAVGAGTRVVAQSKWYGADQGCTNRSPNFRGYVDGNNPICSMGFSKRVGSQKY